jgi:hypothetical protein
VNLSAVFPILSTLGSSVLLSCTPLSDWPIGQPNLSIPQWGGTGTFSVISSSSLSSFPQMSLIYCQVFNFIFVHMFVFWNLWCHVLMVWQQRWEIWKHTLERLKQNRLALLASCLSKPTRLSIKSEFYDMICPLFLLSEPHPNFQLPYIPVQPHWPILQPLR